MAGHVIECGAQATGGNYSFFTEIDGLDDRPRIGFPWAEVAADGSSVIGKHDGTGGAVTVGTVTSQLLYEIGGPEYLGPDVTARFDTIELEQAGPDRVRISGVRGEAPPATLKVAMNELGGYRNSFTVALDRPRHRGQGCVRPGGLLGRLPVRPRRLRLHGEPGGAHRQPRSGHAGGGHGDVAADGEGPRRAQGGPGLRRRHGPHRPRRHPRDVRHRERAIGGRSLRHLPAGADRQRPRPRHGPRLGPDGSGATRRSARSIPWPRREPRSRSTGHRRPRSRIPTGPSARVPLGRVVGDALGRQGRRRQPRGVRP